MTDYKELFIRFWTTAQELPLFKDMASTVEASSWHREANVLVHTQMVVDQYLSRWTDVGDRHLYFGAIAAMFHDVGKPEAEEVRESEERGIYRRYAGHERVSSVEFLAYMLAVPGMATRLGDLDLDLNDVYVIAWMIEHHLPYQVKDVKKRQGMFDTVSRNGCLEAFTMLLRSDCHGRISDDHDKKKQDVEDWISVFLTHNETPELVCAPRAYVLIGSSSSGKSTIRCQLSADSVFNLDMVRLDTFPTDVGNVAEQYDHAFKMSCDHPDEFAAASEKALRDAFAGSPSVVISDNCNLSRKRRAAFVSMARQRGYRVVAVMMMTHPDIALARQSKRNDRLSVPIWQQFRGLSMPTLTSEVDAVICQFPPEGLSD